jgi:RAB protein geranylgeranyltransferase component A
MCFRYVGSRSRSQLHNAMLQRLRPSKLMFNAGKYWNTKLNKITQFIIHSIHIYKNLNRSVRYQMNKLSMFFYNFGSFKNFGLI